MTTGSATADALATRQESTSTSLSEAAAMFERHLRARGLADKTCALYLGAIGTLSAHLVSRGMPTSLGAITREHVEDFFAARLAAPSVRRPGHRISRTTVNLEYRALHRFFAWAVEADELRRSPMEHTKPPKPSTVPPPVIEVPDLRALLRACEGRTFADRRDYAMVRLFLDCGLRRNELASLTVDTVDRARGQVRVRGKGDKTRDVPYGFKTGEAIDRYWSKRRAHPHAASEAFWLGDRGPLTASGVAQVIATRSERAGLGRVNPHRFRHTFAHEWLANGGQEGDLMRLTGWSSRSMLDRYGASAASKRAAEAQRKNSLGDRL